MLFRSYGYQQQEFEGGELVDVDEDAENDDDYEDDPDLDDFEESSFDEEE